MKQTKVVLSGNAGSGKSTVGKMLAEQLGINFLSVGAICREKAVSMGMDINQFQEYLKSHPNFDIEMDRYIADYAHKQTNYVLDYRLGFHFVPESFKVLLQVSEKTALQRILSRNGKDEDFSSGLIDEKVMLLRTRNELMRQRFIEIYGVDFCEERHYDLVVNSDILSPNEIVEQIYSSLQPAIHCRSSTLEHKSGCPFGRRGKLKIELVNLDWFRCVKSVYRQYIGRKPVYHL